MISSTLHTNPISDFLEWNEKKQLKLNPYFQRRAVWSQPARVFLIDTILRELSIPKFYLRTTIDLATKKSMREVVDGQQRLRAIFDFANDELKLTSRAGDLSGYTYSTLPHELQEKFLTYSLAVETLVNANDADVLEVFSRLNSYGETLNAPEKRHATFQGVFKWSVHEMSKKYDWMWEKYKILGVQQRLRMIDDTTMSELYGIILEGVKDGGEPYINKLYGRYDAEVPDLDKVNKKVEQTLDKLTADYGDLLYGPLGRRPQFIMFFAALAHSMHGIPKGDISSLPARKKIKSGTSLESFGRLSDALEAEFTNNLPEDLQKFVTAAKSSTQRKTSRNIRFKILYNALTD